MNPVAETRDRLTREDDQFRRLHDKHQQYEKRLDELKRRRFLSTEEQVEENTLKKLKLSVKDQMERLIRDNVQDG